MSYSPFFTLFRLLQEQDPELGQILVQYRTYNFPIQDTSSAGRYLSFVPTAPVPVSSNSEIALKKMRTLFEDISNDNADYFEILRILRPEGVKQLLKLLYKKAGISDDDLISEYLNPVDAIPSFFRGQPVFRVVVEKSKGDRSSKDGVYDVFLEKIISEERTLINFSTVEAKIMYIWFLTHPEKAFKKTKLINELADDFVQIGYKTHPNYNYLEKKRDEGKMDVFLTRSMSNAKRPIVEALQNRDEEDYYVIIRHDSAYSLKLPACFIELPIALRS